MRALTMFGLAIAIFAFIGCDRQQEAKELISSRDFVRRSLNESGVEMGIDEEHGRVVALSSAGLPLEGMEPKKDKLQKSSADLGGEYFQYDVDDDFQTLRFKAMWRAYAEGLAKIANLTVVATKAEQDTLTQESSAELGGVVTIMTAESFEPVRSTYEVSVAVAQSTKREGMYSGNLQSKLGKSTLAEWIEGVSGTGIICPQSYCDNEGVWWRVAGVPVELDGRRSPKKGPAAIEAAKRYAYEAARRSIAVQVFTRRQLNMVTTKTADNDMIAAEKMSKVVKIEPLDDVLPVDPSRTKWIELDRVDPTTGAPVRCVVAALCPGAAAK